MILSIKGCDLFSNRAVSLRSSRAHINPKCRFKLVSRAVTVFTACRRGRAAELSAGQTGFKQELARLHEQR